MAVELFGRALEVGVTVELEETAKRFLVDKGYDPKFGARPLRRAIQKYVEDPMAEAILGHDLGENDSLVISYDEKKDTGELSFRKKKKKAAPKKKSSKAKEATPKEKPDKAVKPESGDGSSKDAQPETDGGQDQPAEEDSK